MSGGTARLLIMCPDRPGIVSAVTTFLYTHGANITDLDQHSTDPEGGLFFMRLEFQTPHIDLSRPALEQAFGEVVGSRFKMDWRIEYAAQPKRVSLLVSRHDHALMELLWRYKRGELYCQIVQVISNHPDLREAVEGFGVKFEHVGIAENGKEESEKKCWSC